MRELRKKTSHTSPANIYRGESVDRSKTPICFIPGDILKSGHLNLDVAGNKGLTNSEIPSFISARAAAFSSTWILTGLLSLFLAIIYCVRLDTSAINVPRADDFQMLIGPLLSILDAHSITEVVSILTERHGEHYIVTLKLIALAIYVLAGELDFAAIISFGNIAVPLSALLLAHAAGLNRKNGYIAVPACFLLLTPLFPQAGLWACAVLEHLWVMVYVLAAFVCARGASVPAICAQLSFCCLAMLTQANGLFAPLVLAVFQWSKARHAAAAALLIIFLAGFCAIVPGGASTPNIEFAPLFVVSYILIFLGAPFSSSATIAMILGGMLVLANFVLLIKARGDEARLMLGVAVFILLTAAANALARGHFGLNYPLSQSRYAYPALIHASATYLAIVLCMAEASRKRVFLCIAPLSAAFWISAHVGATPALAMYRDAAEHSLLQWHVAADGLEHPDRKGARRMLSAAIERGIYSPPALNPDSWETPARRLEAGSVSTDEFPKVPGRVELESCVSGHEYAVLKGFIITRRTAGSYEPHALDLSSPDGGYRFQIVPLPRTDLVTLTRRKDLANAGFMVVIPLWLLDSTGYKLSGLVEERGPDGGVQRVTKVKLNSCRNLPMFR